jgi:hypothetical protein
LSRHINKTTEMKHSGTVFEKNLSTGYYNRGQGSTMASTGGQDATNKAPDMMVNEKLANEATLRGEIHGMEVAEVSSRNESKGWR